jgi:hypothetical protein
MVSAWVPEHRAATNGSGVSMKRLGLAGMVLVAALSTMVGTAIGSGGVTLCVPSKEGQDLATPVKGKCKAGFVLQELGAEGREGKEGKQGPEGKNELTAEEIALLKGLLPHINYIASGIGGKPTIQFTGVNVQVVSGAGKTSAPVNGAGNLIIGYDEGPGTQTGSHNLMLGTGQSYTSYGAIIGGLDNTASGPNTFVVGERDTASAAHGSVSGGQSNTASGTGGASVSGGGGNTAEGEGASVSGGSGNTAEQGLSSVSGGGDNRAKGYGSSVSGGIDNAASGAGWSSVSGGAGNEATWFFSSVSGGTLNDADGPGSSISGGEENHAGGESLLGYNPGPSSISGGRHNEAFGSWSSISGGENNRTESPGASVTGGEHNVAGGGGVREYRYGTGPTAPLVAGGHKNSANASFSAILGGKEELVESEFGHFP